MTAEYALGFLAVAIVGSSCSAHVGPPDGSFDAASPDASTDRDAGFDGGLIEDAGFDGGIPQECGLCTAGSNECGLTMSCREVGEALGYCANFEASCDGGIPDLASIQLSYTTTCRFTECTVEVSFTVLSNQMRVRVTSLGADAGVFTALDTNTPAPPGGAGWNEQEAGCLPSSLVLRGTDCLTHQYDVRLDLLTSRSTVHSLLFSTGSSSLPSMGITQSAFLTIAASWAVVADAGLVAP